jgi:DNA modification methylase
MIEQNLSLASEITDALQHLENYHTFLQTKRVLVHTKGIEVPLPAIHERLFPFQQTLVQWALRKGRAAIFADTGLGKTSMQLEFARLTGQRSLILAPLSVARQTVGEAQKIGIEAHYTRSGSDLVAGINVTNYELLDHFNPADFGAIILDESSILKSLDGETRNKLITLFAMIPYRLCCTATPAPNDITEIANHAEFLGIMSRAEMLAMFFTHDSNVSAHSGWRLKKHAEEPFYRWMASWSMSIKKPSDIGFDDTGYVLPPLHTEPVLVSSDYTPEGTLFYTGLGGIADRSRARKRTVDARVERAAALAQSNTGQWIFWCGRNDESTALARLIPGSIEITGSDSPDAKIAAIEAFQRGEKRVLITKPRIAGFGINLQTCHQMAFVGLGDSFEAYYQCIRRCWRFGQAHPVQVYIVLSDVEQEIYANVMRKEHEARIMSERLIEQVQAYEREEIEATGQRDDYQIQTITNDHYTLMLGDSCERLAEIPDVSIDLSVFSPPFQSLYTYSPTERDLGNSRDASEFYRHFSYIIDHLLRVTKPGRNCCVHVQQIAATLTGDGFIGLKDFRGEVIAAFLNRGWFYHGEVCIDKNPQVQAIRTKAKGLLFVQLHKDASWMRPGLADYILVFRKPGENAVPILPDMTNEEWIQWAHPVWYNIKETKTLNAAEGRDANDERHVCPLQLETLERCIRLWSNPGDMVLDPFAGIGSSGFVSLKYGRMFTGIELKPSYFRTAQKNLERILRNKTQATLFHDFSENEVTA